MQVNKKTTQVSQWHLTNTVSDKDQGLFPILSKKIVYEIAWQEFLLTFSFFTSSSVSLSHSRAVLSSFWRALAEEVRETYSTQKTMSILLSWISYKIREKQSLTLTRYLCCASCTHTSVWARCSWEIPHTRHTSSWSSSQYSFNSSLCRLQSGVGGTVSADNPDSRSPLSSIPWQ